jgi:uncharacterized DUF497 family protein
MKQIDKRITWDAAKNRANKRKHRISFEEAATVFYDQLSVTVDDPEHSAYERRFYIIGESRLGKLIVINFTETPNQIRIISARKPTRKEKNDYEKGRH